MQSPSPSASAPEQIHSSFYRFVPLADAAVIAGRLRELVATHGIGGNVIVAPEGISGAVAGEAAGLAAFEAALTSEFDGAFHGLVFKHSACATKPFHLCKVHVKREIVAFGVPGVTAGGKAEDSHVSPQRWRELLDEPDVLVLDNRNSFEFRLGRFRGAVDPEVKHFRDFPAYVEAHAGHWKREGKRIAMYCTGGIRCEKTSAWMQDQGLTVYQLDGGILNFFQQMPDAAADWQGECFVFDKRIAVDAQLQETATTAEQVYADEPDGAWRLARARRLDPDA